MVLKNKISLVTGSGSGIGRSIALNFAKEGSIVFINDINRENAENTCAEIKKLGFRCYFYIANVGNYTEVKKMFEYIFKKEGRIDILVNNAGILKDKTCHKMSHYHWDEVIKVNLTSIFNCCKEAIINMRKNNYGRIINISSVVGICGNFGQTSYAASKAGVIGFTKSLARESATKSITVNAVAPGFIETDMVKKIPQEFMEQYLSSIPMKRTGIPDDIAKMVTFLASNDANYITGQVFNVNGGYFM
ncbi:MAG: 3-oxoacyl-[acyl-carrier-protein] reductase [Actinobacteria bacterium]|nr:3-oxoacyl-[acyl-carrier-protein] reductase [Actinomycetota bacterium]